MGKPLSKISKQEEQSLADLPPAVRGKIGYARAGKLTAERKAEVARLFSAYPATVCRIVHNTTESR
jgi:hypothetical protein